MRTVAWLGVLVACDSGGNSTGIAVQNSSGSPVNVTIASEEGAVPFANVAAGAATEFTQVEWAAVTDLTVTVDVGSAQGGTVSLIPGAQNLVTVGATTPPTVKVSSGGAPAGGRW